MFYDVVASIVAYRNPPNILLGAIDSFLKASKLNVLVIIVDNSCDDSLDISLKNKEFVDYVKSPVNEGFGKGHNIAIRKYQDKCKYFLVLNPDVYVHPGAIDNLFQILQKNESYGVAMPKILNPDGSLQNIYRSLPSIFDLAIRRFSFLQKIPVLKAKLDRHELKEFDFNLPVEMVAISGCFMFIRSSVLQKIGGFDPSFFMYFEDTDLSRRALKFTKNLYFPDALVTHQWARQSHKKFKYLVIFLKSMLIYFKKYGFFDFERNDLNAQIRNIKL
jgi:GT2 family glycosyltransferase